jgi:hypothetical protein
MSNLDVRNDLAYINTNLGLSEADKSRDAIVAYEKGAFKTLGKKETVAFQKLSDAEVVQPKLGQRTYSPKAEQIVTTIQYVSAKLTGAAGSQFNAALDRAIANPTDDQLQKIADRKGELTEKLQSQLKSLLLKRAGGGNNELSYLRPITAEDLEAATNEANRLIRKNFFHARAVVQNTGRSKAKNDQPQPDTDMKRAWGQRPSINHHRLSLLNAGRKVPAPPARTPEDKQSWTDPSDSSGPNFNESASTTPSNSLASSPRSDMMTDESGEGVRDSSSSLPEIEVETKTPANPDGEDVNRLDG